ncbi:MAG: GtrA family protein [Chitinophagaceae bacterium]|nr:GtrA family protein [Bacteroidota bacterium]MCC6258242.1 GtrA family protein [Chitinophagaceae bacterium]MCW5916625.1 GtrA family protein [Ferruginibacter sp.]
MRQAIHTILDIFYPPFRKLMPLQTFRYAACGGINTVIGLLVYFIGYRYVFEKEIFDFGFFAFKPHVAALFLSFVVSFCLGFLLNKFIVFTSSTLRGRIQLFRYGFSFVVNLIINYLLLKLLVEVIHWPAMLSQVITTIIIVTISYLSQKHFSFSTKK